MNAFSSDGSPLPLPAEAAPPASAPRGPAGWACALVLAGITPVAVVEGAPSGGEPCRRILRAFGRLGAVDVGAIVWLGFGTRTCDLTVRPSLRLGRARPTPQAPELAVAGAIAARATQRILPEPVVVASLPKSAVVVRLVPPPCWWRGPWRVRMPGRAECRVSGRLIFHGEIVLDDLAAPGPSAGAAKASPSGGPAGAGTTTNRRR